MSGCSGEDTEDPAIQFGCLHWACSAMGPAVQICDKCIGTIGVSATRHGILVVPSCVPSTIVPCSNAALDTLLSSVGSIGSGQESLALLLQTAAERMVAGNLQLQLADELASRQRSRQDADAEMPRKE